MNNYLEKNLKQNDNEKSLNSKEKRTSTFINILTASVSSIIIFFGQIYSIQLFAQNLGPYNFGLYSLARRFVFSIYVVFSAGLTVGIARYIAFNKDNHNLQYSFIRVGSIFIIITATITIILCNVWNDFFALIFLGDEKLGALLIACNYLLISYAISSLLCAVYRGYNLIMRTNIIQIASFAVIPIIVGLYFTKSYKISDVLLFIGFYSLIVVAIPFGLQLFKCIKPENMITIIDDLKNLKELIFYSVPRLPASIAFAIQFMIGPYFAAKLNTIESAGYFATAQNILRLVDICSAGVGFVLLPKISELASIKDINKIINWIKILSSFSVHIGIYISLHFYLFIDQITIIWLGEEYIAAIPIMRITIIVIGFYLVVVNLRSVVDAIEFKPINMFNHVIGSLVTIILSVISYYLFKDIIYIAWSFSIGFICTTFLTLRFLHKKYQISLQIYNFKYIIPLNFVTIILSYLNKVVLINNLFLLILFEIIIFSLYLFLLKLINVIWFNKSELYQL